MKYLAKIPLEHIDEDNIRWLKIEPHIDKNNVVGYYMFLYEDINEPCKWDNWYQSLDIAFDAGEDYGVKKENWEVINEN